MKWFCVCESVLCCVSKWKCIVQLSFRLKRWWHLDLNLMNKWWCHDGPPFREVRVVKCLLESCESSAVRDDGETRARREVEGWEVQEDGGRCCRRRSRRRRRVSQAFVLQSQRDGSGEESQPESDPGEQRYQHHTTLETRPHPHYILGKVWAVKVVR